jgi:hypothetical protein
VQPATTHVLLVQEGHPSTAQTVRQRGVSLAITVFAMQATTIMASPLALNVMCHVLPVRPEATAQHAWELICLISEQRAFAMPVTIPQAPRAALSVPRHVLVVLRQITVRPVTQHKTGFTLEHIVFVQLGTTIQECPVMPATTLVSIVVALARRHVSIVRPLLALTH